MTLNLSRSFYDKRFLLFSIKIFSETQRLWLQDDLKAIRLYQTLHQLHELHHLSSLLNTSWYGRYRFSNYLKVSYHFNSKTKPTHRNHRVLSSNHLLPLAYCRDLDDESLEYPLRIAQIWKSYLNLRLIIQCKTFLYQYNSVQQLALIDE